jgi:hypothetical protein
MNLPVKWLFQWISNLFKGSTGASVNTLMKEQKFLWFCLIPIYITTLKFITFPIIRCLPLRFPSSVINLLYNYKVTNLIWFTPTSLMALIVKIRSLSGFEVEIYFLSTSIFLQFIYKIFLTWESLISGHVHAKIHNPLPLYQIWVVIPIACYMSYSTMEFNKATSWVGSHGSHIGPYTIWNSTPGIHKFNFSSITSRISLKVHGYIFNGM